METALVEKRMYGTGEETERMEFLALAMIAVLVPFALRGPQLLVGSVVNFMLVLAAINTRGWKKLIPLIVLPSISAAAGGVLFGPFTAFLLYLIPFIWVGNTLLVLSFKYLYVARRRNYLLTLAASTALKAGFLMASALLLVHFSVIPSELLVPMSLVQAITLVVGGSAAYPVNMVYRRMFAASTGVSA